MSSIFSWILHLDAHLQALIQHAGAWSYLVLFAFLFAETGFVITPFLPGDSLIFVTGALLAKGVALNPWLTFAVFALGAIAGDSINFEIGKRIGPRLFRSGKSKFLNPENLERTEQFFDKYGGKAIVLARFVPFIRTFAPFVAGTGRMHYGRFLTYNVAGGLAWVALFELGGYFFGNLPFVKNHFMIVVGVVILLSLIPAIYEYIQAKKEPGKNKKGHAKRTGRPEPWDPSKSAG
jgi:membrane-associated protein